MKAITGDTLSDVWLDAVAYLIDCPKGKAVNVVATFPGTAEDPAIRAVVDTFLAATAARKPKAAVFEVETVASTLFPDSWYLPGRAEHPREHLYRMRARAARVHRRISGESETYFDRLVAYPSVTGQPVNQLEEQVERLQGQLRVGAPKSSAYEIGVNVDGDLRVHIPGSDHQYMGFPCLSHISLTLHDDAVHLTALYRNQGFVRKAYGNYVGLARIARFFATELGIGVGEITCVATHADAEIDVATLTALRQLANTCRSVRASLPPREVDRAA